jgi:hypothetical protein
VKAVCAKVGTAKQNTKAQSNTWAPGLIIWQLVLSKPKYYFLFIQQSFV